MVDVLDKPITAREALAAGFVRMRPETLELLRRGRAAKGEVLGVARVAAIAAAKRTAELIPLCHGIALGKVEVSFEAQAPRRLEVRVRVRAADRTGVEMEALVGAAVACLTVYDMLKAVDRGMVIERIALLEKRGGRSGPWRRAERAGATRRPRRA